MIFILSMQPQQIITMNGNVRIKSCDLEIPPPMQAAAVSHQSQSHPSNANDADNGGRAVDNQYSFV